MKFIEKLEEIDEKYPYLKIIYYISILVALFLGYTIGREYNKVIFIEKTRQHVINKEEEFKKEKEEKAKKEKTKEEEIIKENDKYTKIEIKYPDGTQYTKIEKDKSKEKENKKEETKVEKVVEEKIIYKDKIQYVDKIVEKTKIIEPVMPKWGLGLGIKYNFNITQLKDLQSLNFYNNIDYGILVEKRIYDNFWITGGYYIKNNEIFINLRYEF